MLRHTLLMSLLVLPALASAASDPQDYENAKEHPDLPRYPGYFINDGKHSEFDSREFVVKEGDGSEETAVIEGRYWWIDYRIKEGAKKPSSLAIFRNYENAIVKQGGKKLWQRQGGTYGTFLMPIGKGKRYVSVNAYDDGDGYELYIVEPAAMEQVVEVSASEMKAALDKIGFIALYGITFDTGKDQIKPESEPLLNEVVALLKNESGLKLSIEGHTDNVGDAKANKTLSQKRAASVMKWLTSKGIPAARLSTAGFGHEMPVADNRLEEGRAKNRRVELVKKK